MFERFTDRARGAMRIANEQAHRMNHDYIGTEHVLLGVVMSGVCMATSVLETLGVKPHKIRLDVENLLKDGPAPSPPGKLPQTPSSKKAIEVAIKEADALEHNYVGTEHLLLGLMHDETRIAGSVLKANGVTPEATRQTIKRILAGPPLQEETKELPEDRPTADFFLAALKALGVIYPNRVCDKPMERMLEPLAKVESLYRSLPTEHVATAETVVALPVNKLAQGGAGK